MRPPRLVEDAANVPVNFDLFVAAMVRRFLPLAVALSLAGCAGGSPLDPFFLPLRQPGQTDLGPVSRGPTAVSVCYTNVGTQPEQVRSLVRDNCEAPVLVSNRTDLGVCPLLQPIRAVYQCKSISSALAEQRPPQVPTLTR